MLMLLPVMLFVFLLMMLMMRIDIAAVAVMRVMLLLLLLIVASAPSFAVMMLVMRMMRVQVRRIHASDEMMIVVHDDAAIVVIVAPIVVIVVMRMQMSVKHRGRERRGRLGIWRCGRDRKAMGDERDSFRAQARLLRRCAPPRREGNRRASPAHLRAFSSGTLCSAAELERLCAPRVGPACDACAVAAPSCLLRCASDSASWLDFCSLVPLPPLLCPPLSMLRLCSTLAGRQAARSAIRAATIEPRRAAAAAALFSSQASPPPAAAAASTAVPPIAAASATPAPSSSPLSPPVLTPTEAELALLSAAKPTAEQLAAFARDKERAAASKAEWEKWQREQKKFGPAISDKEKLAIKLIAAATALWVAYRAYLYSQLSEPARPAHWSTVDDDAIPAYPGSPSGAARSGSSGPKGFSIPAMSYDSHTLPQIFLSFAEPLLQFDAAADDFVSRKSVAEDRMADLNARRKLGAINSKDVEAAEVALRKIRTEERLVMQPRLAYLRDLYKQRSLEIMQRNQYNAERIVEAATKRTEATPASTTPPAPSAAALKLEVEAEVSLTLAAHRARLLW